jgi:hypothetical protein
MILAEVATFIVGVGSGILLSTPLLVSVLHLRRRSRSPLDAPICACGHHKVYHSHDYYDGKDRGGRCRHKGRCSCQTYIGPTPLPSYYAPEI